MVSVILSGTVSELECANLNVQIFDTEEHSLDSSGYGHSTTQDKTTDDRIHQVDFSVLYHLGLFPQRLYSYLGYM